MDEGGTLWLWGTGKNNRWNDTDNVQSNIFEFTGTPQIYSPLSHLRVCSVACSEYHLLIVTGLLFDF